MDRCDFLSINDQPCRFRLKSGKEIYGVIWEKPQSAGSKYFFASLSERFGSGMKNKNIGISIDLDEIVRAERINGALVG
ncbi:MAG TPA: hypothetical protein VI731_00220 [Bacteroidia bacterium]|nr:hypothetical protein [Bacteroidia bacterium]